MPAPETMQALAGDFDCPRCHVRAGWIDVARPERRQNSTIHRLRCAGCGEQIVAKLDRQTETHDGNARRPLRREYETLCALQQQFPSDPFYGTLEPLGYLEFSEVAILVTRLFPGHDLMRRMKVLDATGMAQACHAAGVWLHRLHDSGHPLPHMKSLDVAGRLAYLDESYAVALRESTAMKVAYRCLRQEGPRLDARVFRAVRLHGDFKPGNMLCDGIRYVGLDVQWRTTGAAVYDLAPFLNHVWLAGRGFGAFADRRYARVETAFLSGYAAVDDMRALRWVQLYFALCHFGGYYQRGHLAAAYANWKVGPLLRRLVWQLR